MSDNRLSFATAEDVILHKLQWSIEGGGSDRQWADICGLLRAQRSRLDLAYLRHWAGELGVLELLEKARTQSAEG